MYIRDIYVSLNMLVKNVSENVSKMGLGRRSEKRYGTSRSQEKNKNKEDPINPNERGKKIKKKG